MKDDVAAIPTSGCSVLYSPTSIYNYSGNTRRDYVFNGKKWYLYRTQSSSYNYDTSGYNCINVSDLNSNASFEPIFYAIGFMLFVFSLILIKWSLGGVLAKFK